MELHALSIYELKDLLAKREVTAVEATNAVFERIDRTGNTKTGSINASTRLTGKLGQDLAKRGIITALVDTLTGNLRVPGFQTNDGKAGFRSPDIAGQYFQRCSPLGSQ